MTADMCVMEGAKSMHRIRSRYLVVCVSLDRIELIIFMFQFYLE